MKDKGTRRCPVLAPFAQRCRRLTLPRAENPGKLSVRPRGEGFNAIGTPHSSEDRMMPAIVPRHRAIARSRIPDAQGAVIQDVQLRRVTLEMEAGARNNVQTRAGPKGSSTWVVKNSGRCFLR